MPFLLLVDPALRSANNGFVLTSAALVLMMTPALALFMPALCAAATC
jgi:ammonia channel protein AmtB